MLSLILFSIFSFPLQARHQTLPCDLTEQYNQPACTFVLLNGKTNRLFVSNKKRAQQRMSPFSTFKIAHSLIALELGLVESSDDLLSYNQSQFPEQNWWPTAWRSNQHSLRSAFKHSVVPIYKTLAQTIGEERMQINLKKLNYGNRDMTSGLSEFWLDNSLKISAIEQVNFIKKLQSETFKIQPKSYQELAKIMLIKATEDYQIYAKTGGGEIDQGQALGWYVGYIIKGSTPYYFAVNTDGPNYSSVKQRRIDIALQSLIETHVLPPNTKLN